MGIKRFFQTDAGWDVFILRVVVGVVIFSHGGQKLFGWFGGNGFSAAMKSFTEGMHFPAVLAFLEIITESLGSIGMIVGFLTRLVAIGYLCIMVVAIWMVHWPIGFYMNWHGKQAGEGFEYHLLVIGISLALLIVGAGKGSIDRLIGKS